jgi:tetratricopeptide (TPR) repeat protein
VRMRKALPDCKQLMGNFAEGIASGTVAPDVCEAFLILYALQGCDQHYLWEAGMRGAIKGGENPWLYRLSAAEAHNRGALDESLSFWQKALALENSAALKAMDKLQTATIWTAEKDYRKARTAIQEAIQFNPNWGAPYAQLMDLYLDGSKNCSMSEFERKAMYWLLMDLCQQMQNADVNYAEEAAYRLYLYENEAPTNEEVTFRGLREGDSYPLKCWMNTATTVKTR